MVNMEAVLFLVIFSFVIVYLIIRFLWYKRVAEMLEVIAEERGFKGNTKIFNKAVSMTGVLGAMTVLALPDKKLIQEVRALREEVAVLREQLKGQ